MVRVVRGAVICVLVLAACSDRGLSTGAADFSSVPDAAAPDDARAPDLASVSRDLAGGIGVACGGTTCDTTSGLVCCETFPATCVAGPCSPGTQTTGCDGPEDCAGQICCLRIQPFGSFCQPTCSTSGDERGRICHTLADCGPNQICCPLKVSGGLSGCVDGTPNPSCT